MSDERQFPILRSGNNWKEFPHCPKSIPWSLVEAHKEQAVANHYQSLERLAARGGLSPKELWFILRDSAWRNDEPTQEEAIADLLARL